METRERYRGGGGSGPLPGGRGPGSGAEKGGAAGPGQPPPVGVVAQPLGCRASPKTPSPNLAEMSRGYRRPGGRTDWTRGGRRTGAGFPHPGKGAGARVPQRGPQRLLGAGYTFTAKFRRLKRFTPDHTSLDFQTQRFGCHLV